MRFIKENPALAAGIGLPVLLVILFSLATIIPQSLVEPPKYDFVFTMQDSKCIGGDGKVHFEFIQNKVKAKYSYPKKENNYSNCYDSQRIYRFDTKTLTSKEITFEIPAKNGDEAEWKDFEIAELKNLKIDNSPVALDGYKFVGANGYYNGGIFPFGGGYSRSGLSISKSGRTVEILPDNRDGYYSYGNTSFIGWVIAEEQK